MRNLTKRICGVAVIAVVLFSSAGCGKYEEGPSFSLRSKKNRLTGTWKVTELKQDGVDKLTQLESFGYSCNNQQYPAPIRRKFDWKWTFDGAELAKVELTKSSEFPKAKPDCTWEYGTPGIEQTQSSGQWTFTENKEILAFSAGDKELDKLMILANTPWTIYRLTNKEMKLKSTVPGKLTEVTLEKE